MQHKNIHANLVCLLFMEHFIVQIKRETFGLKGSNWAYGNHVLPREVDPELLFVFLCYCSFVFVSNNRLSTFHTLCYFISKLYSGSGSLFPYY